MSSETQKNAIYLSGLDILKVMSVMRLSDCAVDFFGDISRISICARAPFVCFDERSKYNALKEYEINDLCGRGLHKEYIFSFATILEGGDGAAWNSNILDHAIVKINKVLKNSDREKWPSTAEYEEIVPYDSVRRIKNKKFGSRFIRIEK
jgi:hypothetical protein